MQVSLLVPYLSSLIADPFALVMSVCIIYTGYLMFGLEPTSAED